MFLSRVEIVKYRGIENLKLELSDTTVLVGENNAGKTTVLHALRTCLLMLRQSFRSPAFDDFDFYFENNTVDPTTADPINITLTFEEPAGEPWPAYIEEILGADGGILALMPPDDHYRIKLRVKGTYSVVTKDIDTEYDFLDANDNPLPLKNKGKLTALQRIRPFFYLSALRDASKEFSKNAQFWAPFIKNSQIDAVTKARIEDELQALNDNIIDAHGTFKEVSRHLSTLQKLVSLGNRNVVSVDAVPTRVFDMLSKTQVSIESSSGAKLPIIKHGEGTQSLTVLMLFDAFLKAQTAVTGEAENHVLPIVALEEPEAHLHPNAVRALWQTLSGISGQKIIATHSGDLLSEVDLYAIRRLYKKQSKVNIGIVDKTIFVGKDSEKRKFEFLVKRSRGELFFARAWLLGEGETEAILFNGVAEVLGIDLAQAGVRCVEYRQGDIAYFLDVAKSLGIPWHCLTDSDPQGGSDETKVKARCNPLILNRHLTTLGTGQVIEAYLARNGFLNFYENNASPQKLRLNAVDPAAADYIDRLVKCLNMKKPDAAHEIVALMKVAGKSSVPEALKKAVIYATALARRG